VKKNERQSGFSLIELLVVIFIIGVLASLLTTNLVGTRDRAQDSNIKSSLQELKKGLRIYYNDYQSYPDDNSGQIVGCGAAGDQICGSTTFSNGGTTIYMKELPETFSYYSDGDEEFLLVVELDNASDQDIIDSQANCSPDSRVYFSDGPIGASEYVVCES
jgi:prepilin-type N-terminal cleavage/methylation domain-containing protein